MVKLWDEDEARVLDEHMEMVSKFRMMLLMLNGIRNMAKQEADNGSQSWAMVVEDIDRLLND